MADPAMPKISVIIPAYNRGGAIKETIDSVLDQTLSDFELLIINDGSSDNTMDVVGSIHDKRIRCFNKKNGGTASARNFGMLAAKAEYIALLDHDDLWENDHLKILNDFLDENRAVGLAYTKLITIDKSGKKIGEYGEPFSKNKLEARNFIMPSSVMLRRECFKEVGGFDEDPIIVESASEDWDYFLRISDLFPCVFINKATCYGVKGGSHHGRTVLKNGKYFDGKLYVLKKRFEAFKRNPRGVVLAPYDGYYFYIYFYFEHLLVMGANAGLFDRQDFLLKKVLPVLEALRTLDIKNIEILMVLAILYMNTGQDDKALAIIKDMEPLIDQPVIFDIKRIREFAAGIMRNAAETMLLNGNKNLALKLRAKAGSIEEV